MVETSALAAFLVGFASFLSPCVLPLVPGYLSTISGISLGEIKSGEKRLRRVMLPALIFCLSFTVVFVALGMSATSLGQFLAQNRDIIDTVAGVMIILLGLLFILMPFVEKLNKEWRPEVLAVRLSGAGPIVAGLAFAVAWTPCIGPTLGAILTAAATLDTVAKGGVLLLFYSLGLAVPFLLTALAFDKAMLAFRFLRDRWLWISFFSGLILIAMGVLILTGQLTYLNIEAQKLMQALGLDFIYNL